MQQPLAQWNQTRDCWETTQQSSLLSERSDVFSETWPRSGSMRNGAAYELPTWVPATDGNECSSSPGTPAASTYKGTGPKGSKSQRHLLGRGYLAAQNEEVTG